MSRGGTPGQIIDAWLADDFQVAISPPIIAELARVFQYPHVQARVDNQEVQVLIQRLTSFAIHSAGKLELHILTVDPDDNIYLACAVESRAGFLVTGNQKHFFEVGASYQGIRIVNPAQFRTILTEA